MAMNPESGYHQPKIAYLESQMFLRTRSRWGMVAVIAAVLSATSRADTLPNGCALSEAPLAAYDRFLKASFGKHEPMAEAERQFLEKVWTVRSKKEAGVDDGMLNEAMEITCDRASDT